MRKWVWLWRSDGYVGLVLIHLDVGHQVLTKPVLGELEMVKWCRQKVETTSAVQMLKTQQVLERERERIIIAHTRM